MTKPSIQLFSVDLDGTLLGIKRSSEHFLAAWSSLDPARRPWLVYNSGRTVPDVQRLIVKGELPEADVIIGSVGTELHVGANAQLAVEFQKRFGERWDLQKVERIVGAISRIARQPAEFNHAHKCSWIWPRASVEARQALQKKMRAAGVKSVIVYSSDRFLDVLPEGGDKGQALQWLCQRQNIPLERVLVAGDTGNDSSMFRLEGVHRIVVGNALPELLADCVGYPKYESRRIMADGVIEGLLHFGVLEQISLKRESADFDHPFFLIGSRQEESLER